MPDEQAKAFVRRQIDEVWNEGNLDFAEARAASVEESAGQLNHTTRYPTARLHVMVPNKDAEVRMALVASDLDPWRRFGYETDG